MPRLTRVDASDVLYHLIIRSIEAGKYSETATTRMTPMLQKYLRYLQENLLLQHETLNWPHLTNAHSAKSSGSINCQLSGLYDSLFRESRWILMQHRGWLACLNDLIPKTNTFCYTWVPMSNHTRLLFRTGDAPLSTFMPEDTLFLPNGKKPPAQVGGAAGIARSELQKTPWRGRVNYNVFQWRA
jgi:hypothetical protein